VEMPERNLNKYASIPVAEQAGSAPMWATKGSSLSQEPDPDF
jgi:hypothetical protein